MNGSNALLETSGVDKERGYWRQALLFLGMELFGKTTG
jgi:hypothetical protein